MTSISGLGTSSKPTKRRAKAFAFALLPMALALTACGGGSDSSDSTPDGTPYENIVKQLAEKLKVDEGAVQTAVDTVQTNLAKVQSDLATVQSDLSRAKEKAEAEIKAFERELELELNRVNPEGGQKGDFKDKDLQELIAKVYTEAISAAEMEAKKHLTEAAEDLGGKPDDEATIDDLVNLISSQSTSRVENTLKNVLEELGVDEEKYKDKEIADLLDLVSAETSDPAADGQGIREQLETLIEKLQGTTTGNETIPELIALVDQQSYNYYASVSTYSTRFSLGATLMGLMTEGGVSDIIAKLDLDDVATIEEINDLIEDKQVNDLITAIGEKSMMNATAKAKKDLGGVLTDLGFTPPADSNMTIEQLIASMTIEQLTTKILEQSTMKATAKAEMELKDVLAKLDVEKSTYETKNVEELIGHITMVINSDLKDVLTKLGVETGTDYDDKSKQELIDEITDKIASINTAFEDILTALNVDTDTDYEDIAGNITKPYDKYYDDISDLEKMSEEPAYLTNENNGWSSSKIISSEVINRLAESYNDTISGKIDSDADSNNAGMNGRQISEYLSYLEDVEENLSREYTGVLGLKDFILDIAALNTFNSDNSSTSKYISTHTSTNATANVAVEDATLPLLVTKYGEIYSTSNTDGWGQSNLAAITNVTTDNLGIEKMITGYKVDNSSPAQLSFYHSTYTNTTPTPNEKYHLGMDLLHMSTASLFLYYYEELDEDTSIDPDARRSDVHAALSLNSEETAAVGIVSATAITNFPAFPDQIGAGSRGPLKYKGVMMAVRRNTSNTFMGDVEATLKFVGGQGSEAGDFDGMTIKFENILETSEYLAGTETGGQTIKFEIDDNDFTGDNQTTFKRDTSGKLIHGTFYSNKAAADTATTANNYGNRDFIAGTFESRADDEINSVQPLVGVFGADAQR